MRIEQQPRGKQYKKAKQTCTLFLNNGMGCRTFLLYSTGGVKDQHFCASSSKRSQFECAEVRTAQPVRKYQL